MDEQPDRPAVCVDKEDVEGRAENRDILECALPFDAIKSIGGIDEQGGFGVLFGKAFPHGMDRRLTASFESSADLQASTRLLDVTPDGSDRSLPDDSAEGLPNAYGSDVVALFFEGDQSASEESCEGFRVHELPAESFGHFSDRITKVLRRRAVISRAKKGANVIAVNPGPAPRPF